MASVADEARAMGAAPWLVRLGEQADQEVREMGHRRPLARRYYLEALRHRVVQRCTTCGAEPQPWTCPHEDIIVLHCCAHPAHPRAELLEWTNVHQWCDWYLDEQSQRGGPESVAPWLETADLSDSRVSRADLRTVLSYRESWPKHPLPARVTAVAP